MVNSWCASSRLRSCLQTLLQGEKHWLRGSHCRLWLSEENAPRWGCGDLRQRVLGELRQSRGER